MHGGQDTIQICLDLLLDSSVRPSRCGRQVECAQCISGSVLRESQTDGTPINGTRTVWTQKSQKAGRYTALLPSVQSSISLSFTFCYS